MTTTISHATESGIYAAAEWALLDRCYENGQALFDSGTREDQLDFLLGLLHMAKMNFAPNGMLEMHDYFEPAFVALVLQESPFTGRPVAPRTGTDTGLGTTGAAQGKIALDMPLPSGVPTVTIPDGTFTVVFSDGDYRTVKLKTDRNEFSNYFGKTIASYISGPDNETDFQGFAFVTPQGEIRVWKRFQDIDRRWPEAVATVIGMDDEGRSHGREAYALRSGRCSKCGRKLTVPASLYRGMGPECASRI